MISVLHPSSFLRALHCTDCVAPGPWMIRAADTVTATAGAFSPFDDGTMGRWDDGIDGRAHVSVPSRQFTDHFRRSIASTDNEDAVAGGARSHLR